MDKSLRQKRSGKLKISAPTLISAPASATTNTIAIVPSAPPQPSRSLSTTRPQGLTPGSAAVLRLPGGANGSTESIPRSVMSTRSRGDDRTADLVKRRYSTRFNQLPDMDGPPIPTMPVMPQPYAPRKLSSRDGEVPKGIRTLQIEPGMLQEGNFRAEEYITGVLSDASEAEIDQFQRDLRQYKSKVEVDLQHSVFANRTSFITIGKEAETVRGEMRNLRGLISDVTSAMSQISATSGGDSFMMPRGRGNRSSVANLEALWNSHLQQLWKRVEGTQKFLPAIPGRHVVYESGKWTELNSATWKPRRRVHVILLNDHFVIAGEKKRGNTEASRDPKDKGQGAPLTLIKCWPLQEVHITDLPQRAGVPGPNQQVSSTSINVRAGPETMTFSAENQDLNEKLALLSNFRKTFEDLRKNLELETQDQISMPASISNGLASPVFKTGFFGDYSFSGSSNSNSNKADLYVDVDGKPQSLRQVEAEVDDLDINIALQSFDEAVALTEKLRRVVKGMKKNGGVNGQTVNGTSVGGAPGALARKLEERTGKLAGVLLRYVADNHNWMASTRRNVDWLTRLGYEDRAREAYLDARTEIIQKRIRQVMFDGDLRLYIFQISYIYFTMIKHTALIFQSCFPIAMLSACVKWAKEHVDGFNLLLERQLSKHEGTETYKDCMERAMIHARMLSEVGFDFGGLVGRRTGLSNNSGAKVVSLPSGRNG